MLSEQIPTDARPRPRPIPTQWRHQHHTGHHELPPTATCGWRRCCWPGPNMTDKCTCPARLCKDLWRNFAKQILHVVQPHMSTHEIGRRRPKWPDEHLLAIWSRTASSHYPAHCHSSMPWVTVSRRGRKQTSLLTLVASAIGPPSNRLACSREYRSLA